MRNISMVAACTMVLIGGQIEAGAAGWGDGPGCGLGKMIFDNQPKSILMQHFGSTSNVPSQPFAISSGTSGCTNNGMIVQREVLTVFVSQNVDHVSQDMARGRGEYLSSLATLMGVPPERQAEFFALAQETFLNMMQEQGKIVEAAEVEIAPRAVLIALQEGMRIHSIPDKTPSNH
jgi:Protein of unknown function (DUF3015)